jgi:UDP-glucose 4-epimerase
MSDAGQGRSALVTGGAGFIGSHLVEGLLERGWRVRVLDDFSTGFVENLAAVRERVELLRGDVRDAGLLARAVEDAEVVFHQAAIPSVPRSVEEPYETHDVNLNGTVRLLEAARDAGVRRVVFAASAAIYGESEVLPKLEDMPPAPASPYALQKYAGECYCAFFSRFQGLETAALRYFNVYGPRQSPSSAYASVIPLFVRACLESEMARIDGDGEQTRDFVFVGDVVRANLLAADAPGISGTTMNVASGRSTSVNELLATIQDISGIHVPPKHSEARAGDVRHSRADIGRARRLLGFEPRTTLQEGLRDTVEHSRNFTIREDVQQ